MKFSSYSKVKKDTVAVYVVDIDAFAVFALKSERINILYNPETEFYGNVEDHLREGDVAISSE